MTNQSDSTAAFLEKSAEAYHSEIVHGWENLYEMKRERLYRALKPYHIEGHALELGSADGIMTQKLLPDFERLTVVDGSATFLDKIRTTISADKLDLIHELFENYKPQQPHSTIFMTHILEHLEDPLALLRRARTWLAPGGKILIAVPNASSIHRMIGVKMGMLERSDSLNEQDVKLGHLRVYTPDLLREHVTRAGLRVAQFGGLMVKPLSNRQIEEQWSSVLIDAFFALSEDLPELCSEIYVVAEPNDAP